MARARRRARKGRCVGESAGGSRRAGRGYVEEVSRFELPLVVGLDSVGFLPSFASFEPVDSLDVSPFESLESESEPEPLPPPAPSLASSFSREPDFLPPARLSVR